MSRKARREILIDEARKLHAAGFDVARLVDYFDVKPDTVRRWINPAYDEEQRAKSKERRKRYQGTCIVCGARTTGSNGLAKAPKYCPKHALLNPDRVVRDLWPKKRIIRAMQDWAAIHGEPPSLADWNPWQARALGDEKRARYFEQNKDLWPWFNHVIRRFGTWNAAIKAAGFTPRPPYGTPESAARNRNNRAVQQPEAPKSGSQRYWTQERIIEKIHEYHAVYGRLPRANEWMKKGEMENGYRRWPSTTALRDVFGSWSRGIRAAGFEPLREKKVLIQDERAKKPRHKARQWTKEEVINLMQAWAEKHRLPPTKTEWKALPERPSPTTVHLLFGSWSEAIKQAGFPPYRRGASATNVRKLLPLPRER